MSVRVRSQQGKKILAPALAETDPELLAFMRELGKRRGSIEEVQWEYDDKKLQKRLRDRLESASRTAAADAVAAAKKTLSE